MPAPAAVADENDLGDFAQFVPAQSSAATPDDSLGDFAQFVPSEHSTEAYVAPTPHDDLGDFAQFIPVTPTSESEKALAETPKLDVSAGIEGKVTPPQIRDIFDQSIAQQEMERNAGPNVPDWLNNAAEAAVETASGFVPKTVGEAVHFLTPAADSTEDVKKTFGLVRDMIAGKSLQDAERANFPESFTLVDADKTPPFSKERFKAGFGVLAQMGMLAGGVRGLGEGAATPTPRELRPSGIETPFVPDVPPEPGTPAAKIQSLETKLGGGEVDTTTGDGVPIEPAVTSEPETAGVASEAADTPAQEGTNVTDQISSLGRFASDLGLGLKASQVPGIDTVIKPWVDTVQSFVPIARGVRRFTETAGQRDEVAAKFDAANNSAGLVARQARNHVRLTGDSELKQQAATFVRQANGDKAGMIAKLNSIRGKGYDNVIEYAIRNWDALEPAAEAAKRGTDAAFKEAETACVNVDYRDNYVKGAYQDPVTQKVIIDETTGGRGASTSFKKAKVFNDYAEAIAAGFKPKELRLDNLTESAVNSMLRVVNRKKWSQSLGEIKMPNGEPVTTDLLTDPNKPGQRIAPRGYKPVQVSPGDLVAVHEDLAPTVSALTSESMIPKLLTHGAAFLKHNILVFDIFHGSRFGQMQAAFERRIPSYHKGLGLLEFADQDLPKAVSAGIISPKEAEWAATYRPKLEGLVKTGLNVGRISDALYADAVPLLPGARQTNKFIFEKLSRGVITQSAMTALERNARLYPEWTPEKLNRYTAKEVNTYYRNLGSQGVFKSKTFQDLARAVFFAPQWIEGLVRSEGRGYGQFGKLLTTGKTGNIGAAMGTGLVSYFAATQLVNLITRGKPTWENPEPGHKFDAWVPDFIQGSNGFFISPLSVFAETTHDSIKYAERGQEPLDVTAQLLKNKLHPQVHALWTLFGGKDFFGRPLYGWDRVTQAAKDVAPIPMFARTGGYRGGAQRQVMSTLGIKATVAPTSVNDIYQLAANYKREHGLSTPADNVHIQSEYADLRRALHDGDMAQAKVEYDALRKTKSAEKISAYFKNYPARAFTGSREHDKGFKRSLDRGQMDIYNAALREREEVTRLFRELPK